MEAEPYRPLGDTPPMYPQLLAAILFTTTFGAGEPRVIDASDTFFAGGEIPNLRIEVEPEQLDVLRADPRAYVKAASDPDPAERRRRLEKLVDMDAFCTFMAIERMTCHWDGYANSANNYRVYFDPNRGKAIFLPHGMDQMFNELELGLFDQANPMIASAVLQSDALRTRYRKRVEELIPLIAPADGLIRRVDEVAATLRPVIEVMDHDRAVEHGKQVEALKERLVARAEIVRRMATEPDEPLQEFDERGETHLEGWWPASETEHAVLDEVERAPKEMALHIRAGDGEPCVASWRRHVHLGPGRYVLHAEVRTDKVVKRADEDESGVGIGESRVGRDAKLVGTTDRKPLTYQFRVREDRKRVELVLEMRAGSGEVWFDQGSLRLVRERD